MPTARPGATSTLTTALRGYVDARAAAFLAARKSLGIGELDARALLYIVENPGTRAGDLRGYLGITSAGVTTLTDRLVERDAIRRDPDTADRRIVRLSPSVDLATAPWSALTRFDDQVARAIEAGDPRAATAAAALIARVTAGLSPDEREA